MNLLLKPAFTIIKSLTLFQAEKKSICFTNSKKNRDDGLHVGADQDFSQRGEGGILTHILIAIM